MQRAWIPIFLILSAIVVIDPSTQAQEIREIDLALVLAVDVSGSINVDRWGLQRNGYADAFRSDEVVSAIARGPNRAISVTLVQWAGSEQQHISIPWHNIYNKESSWALADRIEKMPRMFNGSTAVGMAINFSVHLLQSSPFPPLRRVIDVSGDGSNNSGIDPKSARSVAIKHGITINGLPIIADEKDIVEYYRKNVIGGPGAFLIAAEGFESFAAAIQRKLVLEIAQQNQNKITMHLNTSPRACRRGAFLLSFQV